MDTRKFLERMIDAGASDVFCVAGLPLAWSAGGIQHRDEGQRMMPEQTREFVSDLYALAGRAIAPFEDARNHDDDFSFAVAGLGRFRVNVFRQRGSMGAVIRIIPFTLPSPADFHIPQSVMDCGTFSKGLVLVTGPAGSGKSTTLACMVDALNHSRNGHIITMEDPIEYVHRHGTCIVTQREVPTDIASYEEGLRSAMREAPDIILLGEMRDQATISTAVTAAEMAQLIFSTLHTTGGANTVDRIIDAFPANQQRQIRIQLAMVLRAVVSQQLVPTVDGGVLPAFEVMVCNPAIRTLIREEKTHQIDSAIAAGRDQGMYTMDHSLFTMAQEGKITRDTALQHANHTEALERRFADADRQGK